MPTSLPSRRGDRQLLGNDDGALRGSVRAVSGDDADTGRRAERARRRAARQIVGEYHEQQLRELLERVRDGFTRLDRGEIDPFELDDLIHHYKRAAQKLWSFCGASGADWERAAIWHSCVRTANRTTGWTRPDPRVKQGKREPPAGLGAASATTVS